MLVAQGIVDVLPVATALDQVGILEGFQLVGYGGHREVEALADPAYAHLAFMECPQYAYARTVPEYLEEIGHIHDGIVIQHAIAYPADELFRLAFTVFFFHINHLNTCSTVFKGGI